MRTKPYYSIRTGKNPNAPHFDLPMFRRLFIDLYKLFLVKDYFQEAFGFICVDNGEVLGTLGPDIEGQMLRKLRKENLWPIIDKYASYSEDDLFDVLEFLHYYVSKPVSGEYHSWNDCGWHYKVFDVEAGQQEFRTEINDIFCDYQGGYELSE